MKTIVLGAIAIIILFFANLACGIVNIPLQYVFFFFSVFRQVCIGVFKYPVVGSGCDYFGLSDRRNLPLYSVGIATAGGDCRFAFGRSPRHERLAPANCLPQPPGGP